MRFRIRERYRTYSTEYLRNHGYYRFLSGHSEELRYNGVSPTTAPMPTERILVVDDEEAIREVVTSMLGSAGYKCQQASS